MWVHICIHFQSFSSLFLSLSFFPPLFLPFYSSWFKSYSCTLWIQLAFIFQTNYHHLLSWNRNIESDSNKDEQRESTINWWSFDGSMNPFVGREEKGLQLWLLSNPIWYFFLSPKMYSNQVVLFNYTHHSIEQVSFLHRIHIKFIFASSLLSLFFLSLYFVFFIFLSSSLSLCLFHNCKTTLIWMDQSSSRRMYQKTKERWRESGEEKSNFLDTRGLNSSSSPSFLSCGFFFLFIPFYFFVLAPLDFIAFFLFSFSTISPFLPLLIPFFSSPFCTLLVW